MNVQMTKEELESRSAILNLGYGLQICIYDTEKTSKV